MENFRILSLPLYGTFQGSTFSSLGLYFTTVMLGLGIHGLIVLPLLYGELAFLILHLNAV